MIFRRSNTAAGAAHYSRWILMLLGAAMMVLFSSTPVNIRGTNLTSIGLLAGGLIFYTGVLVIVAMFENETLLSIAILLPSIVAVAIFVYGVHRLVGACLTQQVERLEPRLYLCGPSAVLQPISTMTRAS